MNRTAGTGNPYGLVLKGVWYCSSAGAVGTYRVSSILRLGFGEDGFGRLDG